MYILTRKNLNPTARLLAKELGIKRKFTIQDTPPLIRWGCSDSFYGEDSDSLFNSAELIREISNKLRFSRMLTETELPHIRLYKGVPEKYPVVVRRELQGSKGSGIIICRNEEEFSPLSRYYWSYWYNFSQEYGVHILGGEVVKIFKKRWIGGEIESDFPIRNTDNGYHYSLVEIGTRYKKLKELMHTLYERIPINMCRFDVGKEADSGRYIIIEGNTAPGLSTNDNTLGLYVNFLREKLF